jgi:hypothetical protein
MSPDQNTRRSHNIKSDNSFLKMLLKRNYVWRDEENVEPSQNCTEIVAFQNNIKGLL